MLYAFLLLGLLPMALLPDGSEVSDEIDSEDEKIDLPTNEADDLLDDIEPDPADIAEIDDTDIDDTEEALSPVDEDDVANGGSEPPEPEDILVPVIEDDETTSPETDEDEILDPIDEDDVSENETLVETSQLSSEKASDILDFDTDEDILCVYVNTLTDFSEEDVEIKLSENGEDSEVLVKGEIAAILKNVNNATASNIYLTQMLDAA